MKKILSFILLACCAVPMMAQWQMQPTPNDTLQPVRNLGDGKVAFSIYAPNAKEVGFGGDAMPWGKPVQFTKADNGVWTTVISDLKDGVYRYNFTVDGVKVQDPKGALSAETSALANIGDGKQFYDVRVEIPHGAIAQRYYFSKTLNCLRRLHVWTPAGYEKSADKLPVLYLIHGGGDNDASWPGVGCAGTILDNLLAEGKIQPMVVVMPNGSIATKNSLPVSSLISKTTTVCWPIRHTARWLDSRWAVWRRWRPSSTITISSITSGYSVQAGFLLRPSSSRVIVSA